MSNWCEHVALNYASPFGFRSPNVIFLRHQLKTTFLQQHCLGSKACGLLFLDIRVLDSLGIIFLLTSINTVRLRTASTSAEVTIPKLEAHSVTSLVLHVIILGNICRNTYPWLPQLHLHSLSIWAYQSHPDRYICHPAATHRAWLAHVLWKVVVHKQTERNLQW